MISIPSFVATVFAVSKLVFVTSLVVTVVLPSSVTLTTFLSVESATVVVLSSTASVALTAGVEESVVVATSSALAFEAPTAITAVPKRTEAAPRLDFLSE